MGEVDLPPITLSQTGNKKQKKSKVRNPKKPKAKHGSYEPYRLSINHYI